MEMRMAAAVKLIVVAGIRRSHHRQSACGLVVVVVVATIPVPVASAAVVALAVVAGE